MLRFSHGILRRGTEPTMPAYPKTATDPLPTPAAGRAVTRIVGRAVPRRGGAIGPVPPSVSLGAIGALLRLWLHRARTRRTLAELPARLRRDLGLDDATAREEADKPFWRA
ncbi:DUF1127 domain-containing protein [Roseomonas sp. NAR14]|uniref:DUF1127 domain-containing protein n=1 Tax=Roseomonas acroporae TaxID=2937791 RepID=A0A9X2BWD9_9PROT|nr:DUF1127 domain-containing protein [Roseomonas acroporae]MCK8784874.1 DUF1127 domain-containing protein [Roseomonas acroporae]